MDNHHNNQRHTCEYCGRSFKSLGGHLNRCPARENALRLQWIREGQRLATPHVTINNHVTINYCQQFDREIAVFYEGIIEEVRSLALQGLSAQEIKTKLKDLHQNPNLTPDQKAIAYFIKLDKELNFRLHQGIDPAHFSRHVRERLELLSKTIDQEVETHHNLLATTA